MTLNLQKDCTKIRIFSFKLSSFQKLIEFQQFGSSVQKLPSERK